MLTVAQLLLTLALYSVGTLVLSMAIFPSALICFWTWGSTLGLALWLRVLLLCFSLVGGYFLFGIVLILVVGGLRFLFGLTLQEGEYQLGSLATLRWMIVNAFQFVVGITFMEFLVLSPLAAWFYRLMGAKLGKNVQINSTFCADLSLLEIGDDAVIGGHATVIAHVFERGRLILRKVRIGRQAVVGLNAIVLPGAIIGDRAIVAAGAVVPKDTTIADGTVYYGAGSGS